MVTDPEFFHFGISIMFRQDIQIWVVHYLLIQWNMCSSLYKYEYSGSLFQSYFMSFDLRTNWNLQQSTQIPFILTECLCYALKFKLCSNLLFWTIEYAQTTLDFQYPFLWFLGNSKHLSVHSFQTFMWWSREVPCTSLRLLRDIFLCTFTTYHDLHTILAFAQHAGTISLRQWGMTLTWTGKVMDAVLTS